MNELISNSNILITNILTYVLPAVLVILTLISYSGILQKLTSNLEKIVGALKDFLSVFDKRKIKLGLLILSCVYVICEFLIFAFC